MHRVLHRVPVHRKWSGRVSRSARLLPLSGRLDDIRVGESTEYRRSASSYLVAVRYVYVGSSDIVIKAPAEW